MKKKVLLIDNFDSFTYNIFQLVLSLETEIEVKRNNEISKDDVLEKNFTHIIIGPGPKTPTESGNSLEIMDFFKDKLPIYGICLGMQAMATIFGGDLIKGFPVHGRKEKIFHKNQGLHKNLPSPFYGARYNSLTVQNPSQELIVTAKNKEGLIMGLKHSKYLLLEGTQYHPESFLTENGKLIMENFLSFDYETIS